MNRRLIRILLLFAALWLPVQTMAGMSVSVCMNMQSHGGMASHQHATADEAAAMPCHAAMDDRHAAHPDQGCDNCEICHLASAGFLPSAVPDPALPPVGKRFEATLIAASPSFIAEPPQHPPRQLA